jgi:hypothetical protein
LLASLHSVAAAADQLSSSLHGLSHDALHCHLLQLRGVQQWRWGMLRSLHQDVETRQPAQLSRNYERLLFGWMRLRKAVAALQAAAAGLEPDNGSWAGAVQRWAAAAEQLDIAGGIDAGAPPPKPLLWKRGGRPLLPRSLELSSTYSQLLLLCDASRAGAAGFLADHRGQPAALAAAGVQLPLLDLEAGSSVHLGAEERCLVAEASAAEVATDPTLRAALLEGLCLLVSATLLAQQVQQAAPAGGEEQLREVLLLLRGKVQERADASAAAAAALLQTVVPLPEDAREEEEGQDNMDGGTAGLEPQQRLLVPVVQLTWGDEAAAGTAAGQLPTQLPAELMQYPSCRPLQLALLALQDAQLSHSQLQLFSRGGLLGLLLEGLADGSSPLQQRPTGLSARLQQLTHAMGSSGSSSVSDAAAYQLLVWLLETQAQHGSAPQQQQGGLEWQQLLLRSLVHEAWSRWQQAMWTGAAAALPAAHASAVTAVAQQQWAAAAAGPLRLHIAAGTVLASGITASPATLIADRSARLLQLKLAARQLRAAAVIDHSQTAAAAEWQAAAAVAASTLAAMLPSIPLEGHRQQLAGMLPWLASERCCPAAAGAGSSELAQQWAQQDAQLLDIVAEAVGSSSHGVLRKQLHPVLLPALTGLLAGSAAAHGMSAQGE